jgi:branched-subunit amino acid transport protein
MIDKSTLWTVIIGLGIGSFGLRFAFLGLLGNRGLPPWLLRQLRYTAVSIIPALVAPIAIWPHGHEAGADLWNVAAALVTLTAGLVTRNALAAMGVGAMAFLAVGYWA